MNKETQTKVVNTCIVNALRIDEEHRMMILEKLVQSISDENKNKLLHLLGVSSRFSISVFENEWKKRSRMNFEWEWVEDAGCINKTECRRLVKTLLKRS